MKSTDPTEQNSPEGLMVGLREQAAPLVFAVDLDNVCADYTSSLRDYLAQQDPGRDTAPTPTRYDYSEWGLDHEQFISTHRAAVADGMFATAKPIDGAKEALKNLSDLGVHIRIITHRIVRSSMHQRVLADTAKWLDENYIPYWSVCFIGDKEHVEADVYIDDSPTNVVRLRLANKPVIVYDWPYNADDKLRELLDTTIDDFESDIASKQKTLASFDQNGVLPSTELEEAYALISQLKSEQRRWTSAASDPAFCTSADEKLHRVHSWQSSDGEPSEIEQIVARIWGVKLSSPSNRAASPPASRPLLA